ncbi:Nucleoside triphosphatase NudI [uncultured archaeon]|nr:Nucleoside triphosphatase NudI [uncultured archaeon]
MQDNKHHIAVTGIIIKDGKYLITKRALHKKNFPGKWTVPGGNLETRDYLDRKKDTSVHWYNVLEEVLRREIFEEVGLKIQDIGYITSMTFIKPDNSPMLIISLFANYSSGEVKLNEESCDSRWVSLEEAKNYDLIEGIYEEIEMLDKMFTQKAGIGEWKMNSPKKLRIGIDLDEVVGDFMHKFLEFYNEKNGKNVKKEDIKSYDLWKNDFFRWTRDDAIRSVDEFHNSHFFDEINLIFGAKNFIERFENDSEIFIVTARPLKFKEKTEIFFKKNFNRDNMNIIFSGDFHLQGKTKAEICKEQGITILIEDNPDYALDSAKKGILVFLFKRPWNLDYTKHENIVSVTKWDEVLEQINEVRKNGIYTRNRKIL